jgi:transposase-like protein
MARHKQENIISLTMTSVLTIEFYLHIFVCDMKIEDVYSKFPNTAACIAFLEQSIWDNKPKCPYCNTEARRPSKIKGTYRYQCNGCMTSFSVLVATPFKKARKDLQVWFLAVHLVTDNRFNAEYSCRQLAREIGVTKDTGCNMFNTIKHAFDYQNELIQKINKKLSI